MAPYNFDAPDTDVILCSSDGKEFHVHHIISLASPVFQGMFSLPSQPTEPPPSQIPTVDVPERSVILQPFLQYLYPQSPPKISDLTMWEALYTIADKYSAEVVMESLRNLLMYPFLEMSPLRVYALASHWGFEELAKIASTRTLKINIFTDLPREDASLMGGAACQQLYLLHFNRRKSAADVVVNHPGPLPSGSSCKCEPPDYSGLVPALCEIVATRPWLTVEEVYETAGNYHYPWICGRECRNALGNVRAYLASILRDISRLPQTI